MRRVAPADRREPQPDAEPRWRRARWAATASSTSVVGPAPSARVPRPIQPPARPTARQRIAAAAICHQARTPAALRTRRRAGGHPAAAARARRRCCRKVRPAHRSGGARLRSVRRRRDAPRGSARPGRGATARAPRRRSRAGPSRWSGQRSFHRPQPRSVLGRPSQCGSGTREPRHQRSRRDAQDAGGVYVAHAFDRDEQQRLALLGRQRLHRAGGFGERKVPYCAGEMPGSTKRRSSGCRLARGGAGAGRCGRRSAESEIATP